MKSTGPMHRLTAQRHGAVVVEFAVVLTVLAMMVFAAFEFTRLNMVRHTIDTAAYEGARQGIAPGATAAEAQSAAVDLLQRVGVQGATVTISPNPIDETTTSVTVQVTVPMSVNTWTAPVFSQNKVLTSSVTLLTERSPNLLSTALPEPPPPPEDPEPDPGSDPDPILHQTQIQHPIRVRRLHLRRLHQSRCSSNGLGNRRQRSQANISARVSLCRGHIAYLATVYIGMHSCSWSSPMRFV